MNLRRFTLTAMFAALCAVGGLLKIPLGIGSTALDSTPALMSAAFLPPVYSGIAALVGHTASAMYAGFPLGPFHVLIALEMFVIVSVFARLHKANRNVLKWVFFIIANGLLAPLPFYFLISPAFFLRRSSWDFNCNSCQCSNRAVSQCQHFNGLQVDSR